MARLMQIFTRFVDLDWLVIRVIGINPRLKPLIFKFSFYSEKVELKSCLETPKKRRQR